MARVDIMHLLAFPAGEHAGEGARAVVFRAEVLIQLGGNLRQLGLAVDDLQKLLMQHRDAAQRFDAASGQIADDNQRAARRLEDLIIIAYCLSAYAVFGRRPDQRQLHNRCGHEKLMNLRRQLGFFLLCAQRVALLSGLLSGVSSILSTLSSGLASLLGGATGGGT